MASFLSNIPVVGRFLGSGGRERVFDIAPTDLHNIEANPDRRARCLKHLLKANHVNYSIIYNNLQFDNHNAHILCSAYLLGASTDQLQAIYDKEIESLEPWTESPCEVTEDDWTEYLGDGNFQRAYVDFFEDQLVMDYSYDWKKLVEHYIFHDKNRLVYGLFGGRTCSRVPLQDSTDTACSGPPAYSPGVCV
ncbi:questin oxidase family protein [Candidatus Bathyarchaeota archaeon]|nr:questin oxidase family protein [Candidatus Bathyarchaeota archaeon]